MVIVIGGGGILGVVIVCLSALPASLPDASPTEAPQANEAAPTAAPPAAETAETRSADNAETAHVESSESPVVKRDEAAEQTAGAPAAAPPTPAPQAAPRDSIFDAGYGHRGDVTVAIGGVLDAVDPRAVAGASLRIPQFTSDARFGLGKGWSVVAHVNTILAINELNVGASWSFPVFGPLRGLMQFQTGAFVGMLGSFGFESSVIAPEFRPLVGISLPVGTLRWSLRGELVFAGPYVATVGEVSDTLSTPPALANWNVGVTLEKLMQNGRLWYAGVLMMSSTAAYQNWLLFPDTSRYDYYPRLMVGYEF